MQEQLLTEIAIELSKNNIKDCLIVRDIVGHILQDYNVSKKRNDLQVIESNLIDHARLYIASLKLDGLSNTTLSGYSRTLLDFSKSTNKNAEDITQMDIRKYMLDYSGKNVKNSTLSKIQSHLRSFFNWLQSQEIINKNPMDKIPNIKQNKRLEKSLSHSEVEAIRCACKTLRERAMVEFLYATAVRLDEFVNIKKSDVNWRERSVNVIGKGDKERTVYMSEKSIYHLESYLKSKDDDGDYLFETIRNPRGKMSHRAVQSIVSDIGNRSKIKSLSPHKFRRTFATHILAAGMDIDKIRSILGHESVQTTERYSLTADASVKNDYSKFMNL